MTLEKTKFNNKTEHKKFAIGLAVILTVIAAVQWYLDVQIYPFVLVVACAVLIIGLLFPVVIKPVFILFSYIGFIVGWIMTRVILSLLYYLVFTPIGLVLRVMRKNLLDTVFHDNKQSYWIKREDGQNVDFTKQF